MVVPEKINNFISKHTFSLEEWNSQIATLGDKRTDKKVNKLLVIYYDKFSTTTNDAEKVLIEKLFFANLFLSYVESSKGDFALKLLTSEVLENVKVPQ